MTHTRLAVSLTAAAALIAAMFSLAATSKANAASLPDTPGYSLPLALQESLYFYDAQKSGPAPGPTRTSRFPGGVTMTRLTPACRFSRWSTTWARTCPRLHRGQQVGA